MISVVIPSYRARDLCIRAVKSALDQTFADLEVIVVEDGSHALGREDLPPDPRVRFFQLQENMGGARARNFGVQNAQGNLIAFLDADDWWTPTKLEEQLRIIRTIPPSEKDWLIYNQVNFSSKWFPIRPIDETDDLTTFLIYERNYIQTSGFLMPRRTALRFPFDESLRRHQDFDLLIDLRSASVPFIMCDAKTVYYGEDDGRARVGSVKEIQATLHWISKRQEEISRAALADLYAFHLGRALITSHPFVAANYLLLAVRIFPPIFIRLVQRTVAKTISRQT
jgi:glycosyltransferase involved in cell wall biosynthesis